jgi:hypothetical protein
VSMPVRASTIRGQCYPGHSRDAISYCVDLKAEGDTSDQAFVLGSVYAGWADDLGL